MQRKFQEGQETMNFKRFVITAALLPMVVGLLFSTGVPLMADVINNYYVSPAGNNDNTGTEAAPFLTVTYALSQAASGDVINVLPGTFTETITIANSIVLQSTGGANTTRITGSITINAGHNVTVDGFEITGSAGSGVSLPDGVAAATIVNIKSNNVHGHTGNGILAGAAVGGTMVIENNQVSDNDGTGISVAQSGAGSLTVRYN